MILRITLAGLRLHKGRFVTTVLAVALGVLFVTGTLVFTDSLRSNIADQVMGETQQFATVVLPDEPTEAPEAEEHHQLTEETRTTIAELPEVSTATGIISGDAALLDEDGQAIGHTPTAGLSVAADSRYTADSGSLPTTGDEVALAANTAEQNGFEVGDQVEVLDQENTPQSFTVTGLIDFSVGEPYNFRGAVAFTEETAAEMTGERHFAEIDVLGAEGTTDTEATEAVTAAVNDTPDSAGAEVLTGEEMGERLAEGSGAQLSALNTGLLLFAVVSVAVAGIVAFNTFAILLAQRQRELALLRCVGAHRGQVLRGVLLEGVLIGIVAGAVGVLGGVGAGYLGAAVASSSFGVSGAGFALTITPLTFAVGMIVGVVLTVGAALIPALRTTRVAPLAALRSSAATDGLEPSSGWVRAGMGAVLGALSTATVVLALNGPEVETAMVLVAGAGLVAFLGVMVLGPLLVRAMVTVVGIPLRHLGVASRLASDNARRSPKRAATAMIALTVGTTLISGYSVINASAEETLTNQLDEQFPVDYSISRSQQFDANADSEGGQEEGETDQYVPAEVVEELEADPSVATVIAEHRTYSGGTDMMDGTPVGAYSGATVGEDIDAEVESGTLSDLQPGRAVVSEGDTEGREVGETLLVETERGEVELEIAAIVAGDMQQLWGITMDPEQFTAEFPSVTEPHAVSVQRAEDAEPEEARDAVHAATDDPTLRVTSTVETRAEMTEALDTAFLAIAAMLGLSLLIAVFGIANTMALSVLERSRESALLRALGLSRGQLRRMLTLEAVLLCLTGAGIGIGLGVLFGWAAATASLPSAITVIPTTQIAGFVVVAVLAGVLAAILPGRRAARTSITGALASD